MIFWFMQLCKHSKVYLCRSYENGKQQGLPNLLLIFWMLNCQEQALSGAIRMLKLRHASSREWQNHGKSTFHFVIKLISINTLFTIMRNINKTVIYPAFHANINTMMKMETKTHTKKSYGIFYYGKRKHETEREQRNEIIKHTQFIKLKTGTREVKKINESIFIFQYHL